MTSPANGNPFVGLRPFESNEDFLFFGREEQTLELLQRLHLHHFVAVIGSSGSGKSSLIKAGLIPALQAGYLVNDRDHWLIASMKPGQNPLSNLVTAVLEQANDKAQNATVKGVMEKIKEEGVDALLHLLKPLRNGETNFFLLADQFEELFRIAMNQTETKSKDDATDFVNLLLALSEQKEIPVYVVITMRSDFIGDCTQFFGLPEALNKSQYLVPRLNRTQLKTTIEGPVKLFGGKINPGLTARLLNDSQIVKDELPLLQHALMRTWEYEINVNKNGELDLTDYEKIGRIEKALSNHADEALTGMSETELELTKKLFQALTTIDENGRKIRRPVRLGELEAITGAGKEQLLSLINRFIEGNRSFLVINKSRVEQDWLIDISHESLIRQWSLLNGWVDEEAESVKMYRRLIESTNLYDEKKKDLMTGSELELALHWYEQFKPVPAWAQRYNQNFERSIQYLEESEKESLAAEKRKKKYKRNKRVLLFGLVIVALVIIALTIFTYQQNQLRVLAEAQANSAKLTATEAKQLQERAESGFILARQQSAIADSNAKEAILQTKMAKENAADAFLQKQKALKAVAEALVQKQRADENAKEAGQLAERAKLAERNAITEAQKVTEVKEGYRLNELAREWVEKDPTIALRIEEAAIKRFPNPQFTAAIQKYYEENGFYKVIAEHVNIADIGSLPQQQKHLLADAGFRSLFGKDLPTLKGDDHRTKPLAVSQNGERIATADFGNNIIKLWDKQGNFIKQFIIPSPRPRSYSITALKLSPDGKRLFAGYTNYGSAGLWNTDGNGTPLWDMPEESPYKHFNNAAFSPDGKLILVSQVNGASFLWNIDERASVEGFKNIGDFSEAFFSPNGKTICTVSGGTVSLWDMEGTLLIQYKQDESARTITNATFSETTNALFCFLSDSTIIACNFPGGLQTEYTLPLKGNRIAAMAFSPDTKTIFTYTSDKVARWWGRNGILQEQRKLPEDSVIAVAFSSKGDRILTVSDGEKATLWDVNGIRIKEWNVKKGVGEKTTACAVSPGGNQIITGTSDGTISNWDKNLGLLLELRPQLKQYSIFSIAFLPDTDTLLIGEFDKWGHGDRYSMKIYTKNFSMQYTIPVNSAIAAFSIDRKKLLTLAGLFPIEDSVSNVQLLRRYNFDGAVTLAFSPDGKKIMAGFKDGTIRIWETAMTLEEFLRSDKIEALTEEQKRNFGIR
jgi:WD40 repeat protein